MIVDFPAAWLDDVDIFASDWLLDFYTGLSDGEFTQKDASWRDAKVTADSICKLRMGATAQYHDISDHDQK